MSETPRKSAIHKYGNESREIIAQPAPASQPSEPEWTPERLARAKMCLQQIEANERDAIGGAYNQQQSSPAVPSQADGASATPSHNLLLEGLREKISRTIPFYQMIDDIERLIQSELSPLRELAEALANRVLLRYNDPQGVYETEELAKQLSAALDRMGR